MYGSASLGFAKLYAGDETLCTVGGLEQGKEYGFRVCAMNAAGGASDFSPEVAPTPTLAVRVKLGSSG